MSIFCSCKDKSITTNCSVPALMDKMGRIKMSHQKYRLFENVLLSFCPSVLLLLFVIMLQSRQRLKEEDGKDYVMNEQTSKVLSANVWFGWPSGKSLSKFPSNAKIYTSCRFFHNKEVAKLSFFPAFRHISTILIIILNLQLLLLK